MGPSRAARPADPAFHRVLRHVPIDRARNAIVEQFLHQTDASYLFMIDSDMISPLEAPDRLAGHGKDFVTGMTPLPRIDPVTGVAIVGDFCSADTGPGEAEHLARPLPRNSGLQRNSRAAAAAAG
jgi:hypothetical protein